MRIEIMAPLASGKSTIVQYLTGYGIKLVTEDLNTNPFLELRNQYPDRYTLPCQEKFISDKISSLSAAIGVDDLDIVADFSVWTERAYARHLISNYARELDQMSRKVDDFYARFGVPDVLVYVAISTEEQLARIKNRGRGFEQVHSFEYLKSLNHQIELEASLAVMSGVKTLIFDAEKNESSLIADRILEEIARMKLICAANNQPHI